MQKILKHHWPEYLMEAALLGAFMVSICLFSALLEHPGSPAYRVIPDPTVRRVLMGIAMGLTAIALIFSPWGKQSGAHMNPAVTLTFFRLGKIARSDALFYFAAQFVGSVAGVMLSAAALGAIVSEPPVHYVTTLPGHSGALVAFIAEAVISFLLMMVILTVSNSRIARYTGLFSGVLIAAYISLEAPLSGMSMNPARTFGSALSAHLWTGLWIYFTAPPLGMLLAAQMYLSLRGHVGVFCAKLHHENHHRCIFCEHRLRLAEES